MYKRSSAATALAVPEETLVSDGREPELLPAPAGALHRVYPANSASPANQANPANQAHRANLAAQAGSAGQAMAADGAAEQYLPQRGSYGMRLRGGMPRSVGGRVLLGSGLFVVVGGLVLTVAGIRQFLFRDPRFLISSSTAIAISGNEHLSRAEVLGVFGMDLERNIFKVPLAERQADLERLPWVAHATVMRLLPNHLRVQLTERTPVAFTRQGTQIGLVDADGVLLDMPPDSAGDPHYSFPVLTGLAPNDTPEVRAARMEVFRRFMADLAGAGAGVTQTMSEVDVTNPEDVKALVTMDGADILVHFGDEDFLQRYRAFAQHLPEWRTQYPKLASADMRYERQVVLEMQPGTAVPLAAAETPAAGAGAERPAVTAPVKKAQPAVRVGSAVRATPAAAEAARERWLAKVAAARRAQAARVR